MRRIIDICWRLCRQVPLLPITILAAIPLALRGGVEAVGRGCVGFSRFACWLWLAERV